MQPAVTSSGAGLLAGNASPEEDQLAVAVNGGDAAVNSLLLAGTTS